MPEGDTLFRAARALGERLTGATVTRFRSTLGARVDDGRTGKRIDRVESRGKNLLVLFEDGWTLHTHLRMSGSWRVYRAGEQWNRPSFQARVVIEAREWVAVCFLAPVVRMLRGNGERDLGLGPDLLGSEFDEAQAVVRLRTAASLAIGEAIMVQRLVSGIGNVFKSEVLFLEAIDPFRKVSSVPDETLGAVLRRARTLMLSNVEPGAGMRSTRARRGQRHYVYGRSGEPCFKCGARVRTLRQGQGRSTYFCPVCQDVNPQMAQPPPRP